MAVEHFHQIGFGRFCQIMRNGIIYNNSTSICFSSCLLFGMKETISLHKIAQRRACVSCNARFMDFLKLGFSKFVKTVSGYFRFPFGVVIDKLIGLFPIIPQYPPVGVFLCYLWTNFE